MLMQQTIAELVVEAAHEKRAIITADKLSCHAEPVAP
jgi:hypothetical protein